MSYRIAFEHLPWESCGEGVRHKVHRRAGRILRLVEYDSSMPPHWCSRGHLGTILEGRLEIDFASGTETFCEGDGVDIPPEEAHRHRARVLSDKVTALFVESSS